MYGKILHSVRVCKCVRVHVIVCVCTRMHVYIAGVMLVHCVIHTCFHLRLLHGVGHCYIGSELFETRALSLGD